MHYVSRKEPFRYSFLEPLTGKFQITKINGREVESKFGELNILEISWNGVKISTEYQYQIDGNEIELTLHFKIMSFDFSISGIVIHQKHYGREIVYGVKLKTDENIRKEITDELKAYAWNLIEEKKRK